MKQSRHFFRLLALVAACQLAFAPLACADDDGEDTPSVAAVPEVPFADWLAAFRADALAAGIRAVTLDAAFADAQPVERAIELDQRQPEFLQSFGGYLSKRVTPAQVERGLAALADNAELFDRVEAQYGVPKTVLAAFWGLETRYGGYLGNFNIPQTLATLAWEGRRSAFFRGELLDALAIVDAGHIPAPEMVGSWAGAMGQMQFMPSTFKAYAVDGDGDGRIDLWHSLPDALNSAANYLKRAGWQPGQPVAALAKLPPNFDWTLAGRDQRRTLADWRALGVVPADDVPAGAGPAWLVVPQGWQGPAFLAFANFNVVMRWNRSVNYALAVSQLADALAGRAWLTDLAGDETTLSTGQVGAMQDALNKLGFTAGTPDGLVGPATRAALRRFQAAHGLPADGYPSLAVYDAVIEARTRAAEAEAGLTP